MLKRNFIPILGVCTLFLCLLKPLSADEERDGVDSVLALTREIFDNQALLMAQGIQVETKGFEAKVADLVGVAMQLDKVISGFANLKASLKTDYRTEDVEFSIKLTKIIITQVSNDGAAEVIPNSFESPFSHLKLLSEDGETNVLQIELDEEYIWCGDIGSTFNSVIGTPIADLFTARKKARCQANTAPWEVVPASEIHGFLNFHRLYVLESAKDHLKESGKIQTKKRKINVPTETDPVQGVKALLVKKIKDRKGGPPQN